MESPDLHRCHIYIYSCIDWDEILVTFRNRVGEWGRIPEVTFSLSSIWGIKHHGPIAFHLLPAA
nr:hypothetical protein Iba_chr01eCG6740 [Ipomoea batatas]